MKTKLTLKSETGIYFFKILMSLKKVLEMFLIFLVMLKENSIKLHFGKMRELPFTYTVCQLVVSEIGCFITAKRIQIMTMNKCKRDLSNNMYLKISN